MIYCQEPRRIQYYRFMDGLFATTDGRVIDSPTDGNEASYVVEKGRMKVRTAQGKLDLARIIVWSFTQHRPKAADIGFKDGAPSNCRLNNLIIYEEGENRRKPEPIEVVGRNGRTVYFSVKEASYCEKLSADQIAYILKSPSKSVMSKRCKTYGIISIRRLGK